MKYWKAWDYTMTVLQGVEVVVKLPIMIVVSPLWVIGRLYLIGYYYVTGRQVKF